MRRWISLRRAYIHVLVQQEGLLEILNCQGCGEGFDTSAKQALFRCSECQPRKQLCAECMRREHRFLPFHQITVWTGTYFAPALLGADVGVQIFLGHRGLPCHRQNPTIIRHPEDFLDHDEQLRSFPRDADYDEPDLETDNWQSKLRQGFPHDTDVASDSAADDPMQPRSHVAEDTDEDMHPSSDTDGGGAYSDNPDRERRNREGENIFGIATEFVVGHTNGFHLIEVVPCCCKGHHTFDRQLLFSQLWPTSYRRPKTAFTFRCLDLMRDLNLEAHVSAHAYHTMLEKRSRLPLHVRMPNKYAELVRADRQWRNCQVTMEFGFAHTDEKPGPGAMTHFCVTCPDPDVNLPPGFLNDVAMYVRLSRRIPSYSNFQTSWRYIPTGGMDGNMTADHQRQKRPKEDVVLTQGRGFLVTDAPYRRHLREAVVSKQVSAPPPILRRERRNSLAAELPHSGTPAMNTKRRESRIVPEHGIWLGSLVECVATEMRIHIVWSALRRAKGKQHRRSCAASLTRLSSSQREMDYVAGQMMRHHGKLLSMIELMILSYDIICQWSIHWEERFTKTFNSLGKYKTRNLQLIKAIGSWHVHGHKAVCLARYGFQWILGAGQMDGELVETLWAYLNGLSRTARAMTKAHREECLNDGLNSWNLKKILNTGVSGG